jgi:peptidoglycan/xylan/chitin deacetylase (PgdA/CDA1 family)
VDARLGNSRLAILGYHKIGEPSAGARTTAWYIPERTFKEHLHYLSTQSWEAISAERFLKGLSEPDSLPLRAVLLTFDDGYKTMLSITSRCLAEFGYPSVAFIPTHYIGGHNDWDNGRELREPICSWDDLRELEQCGCSIQSHGVRHEGFARLAQQEQEEELCRSKAVIEAELGKPVEIFAYPYEQVSSDRRALCEALKRAGYRAACLFPNPGGVSKVPVEDIYFLPRVPMFVNSDLPTLLPS